MKNLLWYSYKSRKDYTTLSFSPNHSSSEAASDTVSAVDKNDSKCDTVDNVSDGKTVNNVSDGKTVNNVSDGKTVDKNDSKCGSKCTVVKNVSNGNTAVKKVSNGNTVDEWF